MSVTAFKEIASHIWLVGRMRFASHEANLGLNGGHLVYHILWFFLPLSVRSPDMTEILLIGMLINSINQPINQSK